MVMEPLFQLLMSLTGRKKKVNFLHIVGSRVESTGKAKEKTDMLQDYFWMQSPISIKPEF